MSHLEVNMNRLALCPPPYRPFMRYVQGFLKLRQEYDPQNCMYLVRINIEEVRILEEEGVKFVEDLEQYIFPDPQSDSKRRTRGAVPYDRLRQWALSGDTTNYYKALLACTIDDGALFRDGVHIRSSHGILSDIRYRLDFEGQRT